MKPAHSAYLVKKSIKKLIKSNLSRNQLKSFVCILPILFYSCLSAHSYGQVNSKIFSKSDANTKIDSKIKNDINPKVLTIAFATIEDNALYDRIYQPFVKHLQRCVGVPVLVYPVYQESQVLEALKSNQRVYLASLGTGATMFAVNEGNVEAFASKGYSKTKQKEQYELFLITRNLATYTKPQDLIGKKIAHTTVTSNSGNLAPRALFPEIGLLPDKNYQVFYSGRHDKSIMGVKNGFYDAAAVASDVFNRLIQIGQIQPNEFKILWTSKPFPTNSFVYLKDLNQKFKQKVQKCFFSYKFSKNDSVLLGGSDVFLPINYDKDWHLVKEVYKQSIQR